MGTRHGGRLGVGVAGGMAGKGRRPRTSRRQVGQVGRPGRNSLQFLGRVSEHGRTYKDRGEDRWTDMGKLSKDTGRVYTRQ